MASMQELGIQPILDPLHHTSFPEWLAGGFGETKKTIFPINEPVYEPAFSGLLSGRKSAVDWRSAAIDGSELLSV